MNFVIARRSAPGVSDDKGDSKDMKGKHKSWKQIQVTEGA